MLNELKAHKVPVIVTAAGLIIAFIFGVVPLINSGDDEVQEVAIVEKIETVEQANQSAQPAANTGIPSELGARLAALESTMNNRLNGIDLQLKNLNKAAGRLAGKINKLKNADNDDASNQDLANLKNQARSFDGQLIILNKAVTRLHGRYKAVAKTNEDQSQQMEENATFITNFKKTFSISSE